MLVTLKSQIGEKTESWAVRIKESGEKSISVDCLKEFDQLYSRNIITILFGEDLSNSKLSIAFRKTETGKEFEEKTVILSEAFNEVNDQIMACMVQKLLNPLQPIVTFFTRRTRSFTRYQRTATDNCLAIRSYVRNYIADRKAGKVESTVENKDDLLSVFLSHSETFTDEYIIDELCSLYFASVATSGLASATLLSHFINDPISLAKVRAELNQEIED